MRNHAEMQRLCKFDRGPERELMSAVEGSWSCTGIYDFCSFASTRAVLHYHAVHPPSTHRVSQFTILASALAK